MRSKILNKKFFQQNTVVAAKKLLGKFLVRKIGKKEIAGIITDVEAYDGFEDQASHASWGKTKRNAPMFARGGIWYVYFTYGMHWMLNVVTRERGYPAAVLIRGVFIEGVPYEKTNGPAKFTKFLKIDKKLNGQNASRQSGLWIEDRGVNPKKVFKSPRIGVDYAGRWKHKLWRFYIEK
jgi:DNA-3-methyladenine glycosylase